MGSFLFAFTLTALAGLATGIGSAVTFFIRPQNTRFLAASLGFAGGVMLYVSLLELLPEAREIIGQVLPDRPAAILAVVGFIAGMLLFCFVELLIPQEHNPHEIRPVEELATTPAGRNRLMRTGVFTAIAIAAHNILEGLATFISALQEPGIAVMIVLAIAIHNIPVGITISAPIYYATGKRAKALAYALAAGMSELVGAVIGYFLLPFVNEVVFGLLFAAVAGVMVYLALDELLPASREYGEHHLSIYGVMAGMAVMAASLLLMNH